MTAKTAGITQPHTASSTQLLSLVEAASSAMEWVSASLINTHLTLGKTLTTLALVLSTRKDRAPKGFNNATLISELVAV